MVITPLGSGQEVGRSCHLLEFRGHTLMLDCGIHPGYEGLHGLPYFDNIEPSEVDVLLITHFHLDHAASLPHFTEKTGFKGEIYMTHPTKAVMRLLLGDYLRLMSMKNAQSAGDDGQLYTEVDLANCLSKIKLIDFHQVIHLGRGLKFWALNAGHVLGAAMFMIEIGGRTVLYTGDYSMEDDRHLMKAEIPHQIAETVSGSSIRSEALRPDVLIVEATYGVQVHQSREEREGRFTKSIDQIVSRGGKCLIPVFALGRAQELLLILDEYWAQNPHLQQIPIWYASKLASRALRVYQTYANMMNVRIRSQMDVGNPFKFRYIRNLRSIDLQTFDDRGPSVVFASPGMLQNGVSRQLFDRWCTEAQNGVMIAGYAVENTLAKEIMNQPKEVVTLEGRRQPLNCLVEYVSFSAHVDYIQNRNFISQVNPRHVILVHGQKDEMGRLKGALTKKYEVLAESKRPTITMPENLRPVKLSFPRRRKAKVMGMLASRPTQPVKLEDDGAEPTLQAVTPAEGNPVNGILVTHNFQSKIVSPHDLSTYTQLRVGSVSSKLHVPFVSTLLPRSPDKISTVRLFLNEMFANVSESTVELGVEERKRYNVETTGAEFLREYGGFVTTFGLSENEVRVIIGNTIGIATIEWDASPVNDLLADAIVALLMHSQSSAASIRMTSKPCFHNNRTRAADENDDDDAAKAYYSQPAAKKARDEGTPAIVKKEEVVDTGIKVKTEMNQEDNSNDTTTDASENVSKKDDNDQNKITERNIEDMDDTNSHPNERRLMAIHNMLKEQFMIVNATYTSDDLSRTETTNGTKTELAPSSTTMGVYEIRTDAGFDVTIEAPAVDDNNDKTKMDIDGYLICTAKVQFLETDGSQARVTVECEDEKLATNVKDCIRSFAIASAPISLW